MEINRIFFDSERGRLLETAAMETGLKHFKEKFSLGSFGVDLQPCFTFFALRQILSIRGNPDNRQWVALDLRVNAQSDYVG
jgi:hypothetical protein